MRFCLLLLAAFLIAGHARAMDDVPPPDPQFMGWLAQFRHEAMNAGIRQDVLDDAFADMQAPDESVLALDQKQPEKTRTFAAYASGVVAAKKVEQARALWASHQELLDRIQAKYGVPPQVVLALWGVESNFGKNQGTYSVVQSLATLAYDGRRAAFFRGELLKALQVMQSEGISADAMTGSWAGAMGQSQFMPSSFQSFAVDFDGDGKRDIWNNEADALGSIANYLYSKGWNPAYGWGQRVQQPGAGSASISPKRIAPFSVWQEEGVIPRVEQPISVDDAPDYFTPDLRMRLVMPDNIPEYSYLVTPNYDVIMDWNHSTYFATTVGLFADAIGQ